MARVTAIRASLRMADARVRGPERRSKVRSVDLRTAATDRYAKLCGMRRLPRTPDRSMRQAPNEKLSRLSAFAWYAQW
jgi:hypothetical protein